MRRGKRSPILKMPKRHSDKLVLRFIRESFRFLSFLPHSLSARWAEFLFLNPPRQALTRKERTILSRGRLCDVRFGDGRLATWWWGEGPAVLLVHGWGGPAPAPPLPLLIFHDRGDAKVPLGDGRAIAASWPGAHLVTTRGLGHYKILRSAEVVGGTVSFLLRSLAPAAPPAVLPAMPAEQIA